MTTTISPDMNLPIPVVSQDAGPDWATNINACLNIIDSHNHSSGQGVQITPDGLDISSDLSFEGNDATQLRSVRFTAQVAPIATAADLGCLYESGVDLYYNDGAGNQVRITQSGAVTGASGTITGLPSGTASASFAGSTFTFQSATSTPATMNIGPVKIGRADTSGFGVTISASGSQAANYALTLPLALPASTSYPNVDVSGNIAFNTSTGSGAVVLATSATLTTPTIASPSITTPTITTPTFSGNPAGTIIGSTFSPTLTWNTTAPTINSQNWNYQRIGAVVYVFGFINLTTNADNTSLTSTTIPIATSSLSTLAGLAVNSINTGNIVTAVSNTGVTSTAITAGSPFPISRSYSLTYSYVVS